MSFYEADQFTFSCLDGNCPGRIEIELDTAEPNVQSNEEGITVSCTCPKCGHKYSLRRNDWSDTPDGEYSLNVYA